VPPRDGDAARLVNEIVTDEEGDEGRSGPTSHFDLYREAMAEAGACTAPIDRFVSALRAGAAVEEALAAAAPPEAARAFVLATLELCRASLPERVAAFTLGREAIIPSMFAALLRGVPERERVERFAWYLERHVSVDGDRHGPMAARLLERTCTSPAVAGPALRAAARALDRRIALWDAALRATAS
jgi:hypothetical protein